MKCKENILLDINKIVNDYDLNIILGKKVIEIKSKYVNKGKFLNKLIKKYPDSQFIIIGDDTTDEDMFKVSRNIDISIRVSDEDKNTNAKYLIESQNMVLPLLESI